VPGSGKFDRTGLDSYREAKESINKTISIDAMDCLANYNWPGNVREMENLIERLLVITVHDNIKPANH